MKKSLMAVALLSCIGFNSQLCAANDLPIGAVNAAKMVAKINLNTADINTLTSSIKGIGKKRAQAIIAYREAHKGFKSIQELAQVKGFGKTFVQKNLAQLENTFTIG